jgi:hypothetical protein
MQLLRLLSPKSEGKLDVSIDNDLDAGNFDTKDVYIDKAVEADMAATLESTHNKLHGFVKASLIKSDFPSIESD